MLIYKGILLTFIGIRFLKLNLVGWLIAERSFGISFSQGSLKQARLKFQGSCYLQMLAAQHGALLTSIQRNLIVGLAQLGDLSPSLKSVAVAD